MIVAARRNALVIHAPATLAPARRPANAKAKEKVHAATLLVNVVLVVLVETIVLAAQVGWLDFNNSSFFLLSV